MTIMGREYKIIRFEVPATNANIASSNLVTKEILIGSNVPLDHQLEALLHEVLEHINWDLNLDLDHKVLSAISAAIFSCSAVKITPQWEVEDEKAPVPGSLIPVDPI